MEGDPRLGNTDVQLIQGYIATDDCGNCGFVYPMDRNNTHLVQYLSPSIIEGEAHDLGYAITECPICQLKTTMFGLSKWNILCASIIGCPRTVHIEATRAVVQDYAELRDLDLSSWEALQLELDYFDSEVSQLTSATILDWQASA